MPFCHSLFLNMLLKIVSGNSQKCCVLKCCLKLPTASITQWLDLLRIQANILYYCDALLFDIFSWVVFAGRTIQRVGNTLVKTLLLRLLVLALAGSPGRNICPCTALLPFSQNHCVHINKINCIWKAMYLHHIFSPWSCPSIKWFHLEALCQARQEKTFVKIMLPSPKIQFQDQTWCT